nr:endonuclease/exonuclease/phosphatase family protein [Kofleriaceae bacterium]
MTAPERGDRRDRWRVGTLNIWNRQGPWPERLALIVDELATLDLDALALQEVLAFTGLPTQAHELAAALPGWHVHHAPAMQIGPGLTLGNAILSPHPLVDCAVLPLPAPPGIEARVAAFARVDLPHGPMPLVSTHLTFQLHLGHVRCEQVRALAQHVADRAPIAGPPPVLAGDFNAEPDSDEMRFLRGLTGLGGSTVYFADAWHCTRDLSNDLHATGATFDRSRNGYAARPHEPPRRIDYIYVRGPDRNLRGEPVRCDLAFVRGKHDVWPSDHFGVVADIHAAPRPAH